MRLIDFSARNIPPDQIKSRGYDGVIGYVSESRPGANFGAKPITREYADALRAAGLHIVSNFQYGKAGESAPSDFSRGFHGGVQDAHSALRLHEAAGGPKSAPIFFSIDDDITLPTWNNIAVEWFRGINSILGAARTGIYGHSRVCAWAIEDGVIGLSTTPGRRWVWQTKAWSLGEREPAAVLYQDVIDTKSNPGPLVGDTHVDVSEVLAADYGQWDLDRPASPTLTPPRFVESTDIRSPYHGPRNARVLWFVLHTEDGNSASGRNLAHYLTDNKDQVSYHYVVDNDGDVFDVVDTNQLANSLFEPGNSKSVNLAFAGSWASWSRQTWFDRMQHGIDIAAFIAVRDARRYGLAPRVISPEEASRGETGITDHNGVAIATGIKNHHTDVGPGFPWDYFARKVAEFAALPPAAVGSGSPEQTFPGSAITQGAVGKHVALIQERLNTAAGAGLLVDGEFAPLTGRAVTAFQKSRGLLADGAVGRQTRAQLFQAQPETTQALAAMPPRWVTGPGITTSVGMEAADLGIMRWDPARNAIAAMFGDNFSFVGMQGEWQSPSIVMYDNNYNVLGIPEAGNRIDPNRNRRQLWPYPHNNRDYNTVLPCDFIRVGDWWYAAVMLSRGDIAAGTGEQYMTEFWRSRDLVSWEGPILQLDHRRPGHPGNTMLTFDQIGDYVYIFGTGGLARDKPIWMWRNPANQFPLGYWEPWGFNGQGWGWGIPNENTPILEGQYGELSFRYLQDNCVLSYFDRGAYKQQARTVARPEDNWRDGANVVDYAFGVDIPNLYGGYISPLSHLDEPDGMAFFVSQWIDRDNYRVMLVQDTLQTRAGLGEELVAQQTIALPEIAPRPPAVAARSTAAPPSEGEQLVGAMKDFAGPRWVTGPGITSGVGMDAADLGIMRWDPARNAIAAMFGDNFPNVGMTGVPWESPSIVMYDRDYNVRGIPTPGNGIAMAPRRQLWPYPHNNSDYSTILPCDFIRIGDWWYVAVMVSTQPLWAHGAQFRTEFWRSHDLVDWWQASGGQPLLKLDHVGDGLPVHPGAGVLTTHPGNIMLTFDQIDDYVYIFGTGGIERKYGIWMWRNPASQFPLGWWEPWGWDGTHWDWNIPNENSPILEGAYGELSFRYIEGNCVLSYFDAGSYRQEARTVKNPWDDWRDTQGHVVYASGVDIPDTPTIEQLYGGYISPLSRLNEPNGMAFFVSKWHGNDNYRVYLVRNTLWAQGELGEGLAAQELIAASPMIAADSTKSRQHGDDHRQRHNDEAGAAQNPTKRSASKKAAQGAAAAKSVKGEAPTKSTTSVTAPKDRSRAVSKTAPRRTAGTMSSANARTSGR